MKFLSHGSGYTLFLTGDEAVFSLRGSKAVGEALPASHQLKPMVVPTASAVLRMKLRNANHAAKVTGVDEQAGTSNLRYRRDQFTQLSRHCRCLPDDLKNGTLTTPS